MKKSSLLLPLLFIALVFSSKTGKAQQQLFSNAISINGDSSETFKIASDSKGNIYVAGLYNSPNLYFGKTTSITNNGLANFFIGRYDSIGNLLWAKSYGGNYSGNEPPAEIAPENRFDFRVSNLFNSFGIDHNGDLIIGGNFINTISFDGFTLNCPGKRDGFITKISKTGNVIWARQIGGDSTENISDLSVDNTGHIYICGNFQGNQYNLGGQVLNASVTDMGNSFYAKLDKDGNTIWAKAPRINNTSYNYISSIRPTSNGSIILNGNATTPITFYPEQPTTACAAYTENLIGSTGGPSFYGRLSFLVKLDADGNTLGQGSFEPQRSAPAFLYVHKHIYSFLYNSEGLNTTLNHEYLFRFDSVLMYDSPSPDCPHKYLGGPSANRIFNTDFVYSSTHQPYDPDPYGNRLNAIEEDNTGLLYGIGYSKFYQQLVVLRLGNDLSTTDSFYLPEQTQAITTNGLEITNADSLNNVLFIGGSYKTADEFIIGEDSLPASYSNNSDIFISRFNPGTHPPLPLKADAGNDTALCKGKTVVLGGGVAVAAGGIGPYTYSWSPTTGLSEANTPNPLFTDTISSTYIVTVTDSLGTSAADTIQVKVNPLPPKPIIIASGPTSFCLGDSVVLTSSPAVSYLWTNGSTTQSIVLKNTFPGFLYNYNEFGCWSVADEIDVRAWPKPEVPVIFSNGVSLSSSAVTGNQWYKDEFLLTGETNQTVLVQGNGQYKVIVTDPAHGCSAISDPFIVTIQPLVVNAGNDTVICRRQTINLGGDPVASGGIPPYMYTWQASGNYFTDASIPNPSVTPVESIVFSLTVKDASGSTKTDQVEVRVNQLPADAHISSSGPTDFCEGDSILLTANPSGYGYLWSNGSNNQSITVSTAGSYVVSISSNEGCTVTTNPVLTTLSHLPQTPTIKQEDNTLISSASTGNQWYKDGILLPGETNETLAITAGAQYSVTVTNSAGCSVTSIPFTALLFRTANVGNEQFYHQEFPNPVTNDLTIVYTLETPAIISMNIIDFNGQNVMSLQNEQQITAGTYSITRKNVAGILGNGIYFIRYRVNNKNIVQQIIIQ